MLSMGGWVGMGAYTRSLLRNEAFWNKLFVLFVPNINWLCENIFFFMPDYGDT